MIDLHSHTDQSDGTFTPAELVGEAMKLGLEALAITDHDTFKGYDMAVPYAKLAGPLFTCWPISSGNRPQRSFVPGSRLCWRVAGNGTVS